ncbi:MHYT domain-containing protein [Sphingomonas sp. CJ99]
MAMTGTHDAVLVLVSVAVAVLASFTALSLAGRMRAASGRSAQLWLGAAAVALGGGIWSMHFVAMLAYRMPGMPMRHDVTMTVLSLMLAIGVTGFGLAMIDWRRPRPARIMASGLLIGGGVAGMHYLGMAGMRMPGLIAVYDPAWVAVSVLIAIGAATAAIWLSLREYRRGQQLAAAMVMGAAISGMHYAGMVAVRFIDGGSDVGQGGIAVIDQGHLAMVITGITTLILVLALAAARVQRFLDRTALEQARTTLLLTIADTLRGQDSSEALSRIAAALGQHFAVARTGFAEYDSSEGSPDHAVGWSDGTVPPFQGRDATPFDPSTTAALAAGRTVASDQVSPVRGVDDPASPGEGDRHRAYLIVPFVRHGKLRSILFLNDWTHRRWRPDEIAVMEEVAERIRLFVERQAAENELRALNASLEERIEARTAELRMAEDQRRQADALYRAYFEHTPDRLFVIGARPDGRFVVEQLNPAHEASLGVSLADIDGRAVDDILPPDQAERVIRAYRHVVATRQVHQYRDVHPDTGDQRFLDTMLVPLMDGDGTVVRIIGSSRDVTRQVRAEEALQQAQKMEALGQLTGGVAHDFNNLLTPILGAVDRLHRKGVGDERDRRMIDGALQSAERARTLVHRLLSFARRQPLQPVAVDLSQLVIGMSDLIVSTVGTPVNVIIDAPTMLRPAMADPNQLEMALLNLAVNARDAMPNGGTLTIGVSSATVDPGDRSGLTPGPYICLSVEDTGTGMDADTLARAIEPFFTTKGQGRGTGLGLSMVHGLASQLGGTLTIDSAPGRGTGMTIWLPACDEAPLRPAPAAGPVALADSQVLLVDDEELVRQTTAQILFDLGYRVTTADSGEAALALLDSGFRPDLLITDHLMPGMTGNALARTCRTRMADLPILILSGYADADGIDADLPRLTKPFRHAELAQAIQQAGRPIVLPVERDPVQ